MKISQVRSAGLILLLLTLMAGVISPPNVHAQEEVCYWKLIEEKPSTTVASTAPTATASLDGTTITVRWEGLTFTGYWTAPGAILTPGEELLFEVSTAWSRGSDSELNSVGGVNTYINFNWSGIKVEARRKSINFQSEPDGSISNSLSWTVPSGANEGAEYTILAAMDAAVAGGSVRYKYAYVCEEITPTPTNTVEEEAPLEPTPTPSPTPDNCIWILDEDNPKISTLPAYDDVKIQAQAQKFFISAEGLYITHTWTPFPDVLVPGDVFNLEIIAEWAADRSISFDDPCDITTSLVYNLLETIETGKSGVELNNEPNGYYYEPFTYQALIGKPLQELTFTITGDTCLGSGTAKYTYTCLNSNSSEPDELPSSIKKMTLTDLEDSGVSFSQFSGEIQVFYPIAIDSQGKFIYNMNEYEFARPNMKLPVGTRIYALSEDEQPNSYAVLQFADLSTFVIRSDTLIQIAPMPKQRSNLELLYGKIKVNINRMIKGESLEVRTDRTVTGVEGTHFILEDDQLQTILKVIEGSVKFTSLTDGSILNVTAGQMVTAYDTGLSPITTFDIQAELANWPSAEGLDLSGNWLQRLLPDFLKNPPLWVGIAILLFGLAGLGLFAFLVFIRAINKQEAAKPSTKTMRLVLLGGLLSFSCLVSLCGVGGLYLNLNQPQAAGIQTAGDPLQAALAQTEIAIAVRQTNMAQDLSLANPQPPGVTDQPSEIVLPTSTPTQEPIIPPPQPSQPMGSELPLTGDQFIREHGFFDDFSSDALGWPVMDDGITILKYENEAYRFLLKEKRGFDFVYLPVEFTPKVISFDVQGPANANEGTFGVLCQLQDSKNYYYVDFDLHASQYAIVHVLDGEQVVYTTSNASVPYWNPTSALLQPSTSVNHIRVECYLSDIMLSINDQVVDVVFIDQPYTTQGHAAFFLFTYDFVGDQGYQVLIDNVEIYEPVQ